MCVRACARVVVYFKGTAGLVDLLIIFVLQAVMEGNEKEVRKRKKGRQVYTWMLQSIKNKKLHLFPKKTGHKAAHWALALCTSLQKKRRKKKQAM